MKVVKLLSVLVVLLLVGSSTADWYCSWYSSASRDVSKENTKFTNKFSYIWGTSKIDTFSFNKDNIKNLALPAGFNPVDDWAVQCTTTLNVKSKANYKFYLTGDDGVYLTIDGTNVITNAWKAQALTTYTHTRSLNAGSHTIVVSYYQDEGNAEASLTWQIGSNKNKVSSSTTAPSDPVWTSYMGRQWAAISCSATVPNGWIVAASDAATSLAAASFTWPANCLRIANSRTVNTVSIGSTCSTGNSCYQLIFKIADDPSKLFDQSVASPTANVKFVGVTYAALDGTDPVTTGKAACSGVFKKLPSGFSVVNTETSRDVYGILTGGFPFGADGVVATNNKNQALRFNTINPDNPKNPVGLGADFTKDHSFTGSAGIYYRNAIEGSKCYRLLIRQDAVTSGSSWNTQVPKVTSYISPSGTDVLYGTIGGVSPTGAFGCDNKPSLVPKQWKMASISSDFEKTYKSKKTKFGGECLVFNGNSFSTISAKRNDGNKGCPANALKTLQLDSGTYYYANDCKVDKRIMIETTKRDYLGDTAPCGTCLAYGDPHVTALTGQKFSLLLKGEYVYMMNKDSDIDQFTIIGNHEMVKGAAAFDRNSINYKGVVYNISINFNSKSKVVTFSRNGVSTTDFSKFAVNDEYLVKKSGSASAGFTLTWKNGLETKITPSFWNVNMLDLSIKVPYSIGSKIDGICGSCGGVLHCPKDGKNYTKNNDNASAGKYYSQCWRADDPSITPAPPDVTDPPGTIDPQTEDCMNNDEARKKWCASRTTDPENYKQCIFDCCHVMPTPDSDSTDLCPIPDDDDGEVTTENPECEEVPPNPVFFQGTYISSLDGYEPTSPELGGQDSPLGIPDGWERAPSIHRSYAALQCYPFGTSCALLANGGQSTSGPCEGVIIKVKGNITGDCVEPTGTSRIIISRKPIIKELIDLTKLDWTGTVSVVEYDRGGFTNVDALQVKGATVKSTIIPGNFRVAFSISAWVKSVGASNSKPYMKVTTLEATTNTVLDEKTTYYADDSDYHLRAIDINPEQKFVGSIVVEFHAPAGVTLTIGELRIDGGSTHGAGNLLQNPTFDNGVDGWKNIHDDFDSVQWDEDEDVTNNKKSGSLQVISKGKDWAKEDGGAIQVVPIKNGENVKAIYFAGDSKPGTVEQSDVADPYYSLYLDVFYKGEHAPSYGVRADIFTNENQWNTYSKIFPIPEGRVVDYVQFAAIVRGYKGDAHFDNLYLTTLDCAPIQSPSSGSFSSADPHINTIDGFYYDFYTIGDFLLYKDFSLEVHVRQCVQGQATVNCMAMIKYNDSVIFQIERAVNENPPYIWYNNVEKILTPGQNLQLGKYGYVTFAGSFAASTEKVITYQFVFPSTGHVFTVTAHHGNFEDQWLQFYPRPPAAAFGAVSGLLGNFDNDPKNDLMDAHGNVFETDDIMTIFTDFADAWRTSPSWNTVYLKRNEYNPKTDKKYMKPLTVEDFDEEQRSQAYTVCTGVKLFESCVIDYLLTGGDSAFARGYHKTSMITNQEVTINTVVKEGESSNTTIIIVVCVVVGGAALLMAAVLLVVLLKRGTVSVA